MFPLLWWVNVASGVFVRAFAFSWLLSAFRSGQWWELLIAASLWNVANKLVEKVAT